MNIDQHERDLFCLKQAGYIILRDFVDSSIVDKIESSASAFEEEVEQERNHREVILSHSWPLRTTRCIYCVSRELQDLIMRPRIQNLVAAYLKQPVLRDCLVQTNMPDPDNIERGLDADVSIHRDTLWPDGEIEESYLHVFLLLTDFTRQNGATQVVPGSHRVREPGYYFKKSDPHIPNSQKGNAYAVYPQSYFPSLTQLTAPRGSLILMDPMMIHTQGINIEPYPRRLINTTFRAAKAYETPPLLNAKKIAKEFARVDMREDFLSILEDNTQLPGEYATLSYRNREKDGTHKLCEEQS